MSMTENLKKKAKQDKKTIVLAEGEEQRIIQGGVKAYAEGVADIILLGDEAKIKELADKDGLNLDGIKIINPKTSSMLGELADGFYELRKAKGMTPEKALETVKDELYFGTMMIKKGLADGMVAGAVHTTGDTIRPALQIIKAAPGIPVVSSCFLMEVPDCDMGVNGQFIFTDCGLVEYPTVEQLGAIAVSGADSAVNLLGVKEPKVAMLSYSTKGSAKHENINKVIEAKEVAKKIKPDLIIDGELQGDAALVGRIAASKAPGSPIQGDANVLVFPDLAAGNIAYKLVERLGKAIALGPIIQGLAKPVNDLSRGCNADDVVCVVAITACQAQAIK